MLLSIIIPSLVERKEKFDALVSELNKQITEGGYSNDVEILSLIDNREKTTGEKRNELVSKAIGKYVVHIDDDDFVLTNYIKRIIETIKTNPTDVISFKLLQDYGDGTSIMRIYSKFMQAGKLGDYYVTLPSNMCPHRIEFAKQIPFHNTTLLEDKDFPHQLNAITKTEHHIDEILYTYNKAK